MAYNLSLMRLASFKNTSPLTQDILLKCFLKETIKKENIKKENIITYKGISGEELISTLNSGPNRPSFAA